MRLVPVTLREANAYVEAHHRHSDPVRGCLFCVGVEDETGVIGVAIVGRPLARALQDGFTAEVLRVCTASSKKNACSMLYGACWRGAKAVGFTRIVTYTLAVEGGVSLRASGWTQVAELPARPGWDGIARRRDNEGYRSGARARWEKGEITRKNRAAIPEAVDDRQLML